ncbi:hypothetical protein FKW77_007154 [Venturia effusa]|uniref:Uncharacterized protein n=1 Tax=Venturia effusa TaxID=50376 RepID=A0A517LP97_9PEZI|nr:hypothetical protein FKW77_007154 [Venturia effusa]
MEQAHKKIAKFVGLVQEHQDIVERSTVNGYGFAHDHPEHKALKVFDSLSRLDTFMEAFSTILDMHLQWLGDAITADIIKPRSTSGGNLAFATQSQNSKQWCVGARTYLQNLVCVVNSVFIFTHDKQVLNIVKDLEVQFVRISQEQDETSASITSILADKMIVEPRYRDIVTRYLLENERVPDIQKALIRNMLHTDKKIDAEDPISSRSTYPAAANRGAAYHPEMTLLSLWKPQDRPDSLTHLEQDGISLLGSSKLNCASCTHLIATILDEQHAYDMTVDNDNDKQIVPLLTAQDVESVWTSCSMSSLLPRKFAKHVLREAEFELKERLTTLAHWNLMIADDKGISVNDMALVTKDSQLQEWQKKRPKIPSVLERKLARIRRERAFERRD